jgi:hypothetical protein
MTGWLAPSLCIVFGVTGTDPAMQPASNAASNARKMNGQSLMPDDAASV